VGGGCGVLFWWLKARTPRTKKTARGGGTHDTHTPPYVAKKVHPHREAPTTQPKKTKKKKTNKIP